MGSRGPAPKRSDQVRRRNKKDHTIDKVTVIAEEVIYPSPDENWHRIAYNWYESLAQSAQCQFYEPSDWQAAYIAAEIMSDEFHKRDESGRLVRSTMITELRAFMDMLITTEGERRRVALELERGSGDRDAHAEVHSIMEKYKEI